FDTAHEVRSLEMPVRYAVVIAPAGTERLST
ncbi:MAG: hypothetical protein JWQ60_2767, partial [Pseudonocardia sp.]|nr:hypothetical protein [Pseudonocardia sp.]